LTLDEYQVIQLGCHVTGDYAHIWKKNNNSNSLKQLAVQWAGHAPVEGIVYHQDCWD